MTVITNVLKVNEAWLQRQKMDCIWVQVSEYIHNYINWPLLYYLLVLHAHCLIFPYSFSNYKFLWSYLRGLISEKDSSITCTELPKSRILIHAAYSTDFTPTWFETQFPFSLSCVVLQIIIPSGWQSILAPNNFYRPNDSFCSHSEC